MSGSTKVCHHVVLRETPATLSKQTHRNDTLAILSKQTHKNDIPATQSKQMHRDETCPISALKRKRTVSFKERLTENDHNFL